MREFRTLMVLFFLLLTSTSFSIKSHTPSSKNDLQQQQPLVKVSGVVLDENNEPLPFVSVRVKKDNSKGTATDDNGNFSISVYPNDVLVITYLGYQTLEKSVGNQTVLKINLQPDAKMLSEAVVIGYQTQDRRMVTSSVTSISAKNIEMIPAASVDLMIQGQALGVNIQNFNGIPGGKPTMMIHGNTNVMSPGEFNSMTAYSSPLYVIDGMPMSDDELQSFTVSSGGQANFLASLNSNDIESIDILKDAAAAAIYGSRGANGVFIIKTKRGKTGTPKVSLSTNFSYMQKPELVETVTGATERRRKMWSLNNYGTYEQLKTQIPLILTDSLNPAFNNANNWQDLFYKSGFTQDYKLSVSGGADAFNYRLSAGYYDQEGILQNTGFERFTFLSNLSFKVSNSIEIKSITNASRRSQSLGKANQYGSTSLRGGFGMNPISMPASFFYLSEIDYDALMNPDKYQRNDNNYHDLSTSMEMEGKFFKDFTYRLYGLYSYSNNKSDFASPSFINNLGYATAFSNYGQSEKYLITQNLSWAKTFHEKHSLLLFGGQEFEHRRIETLGAGGYGVPNDNIQVVTGIPNDKILTNYSDLSTYSRLSFFGHATYDYEEKYLLDVYFRADASSRFGVNNRWGYFPSASAAWRLDQEGFIKNIKTINELKLRLSYGIVGDEGTIGDASRYNTYIVGGADYAASSASTYNGVPVTYPNFNGMTRNDLKWQQKTSWNVGLDYGFFDYRLTGVVNVYHDLSERQMLDIWAPESSGYRSMKSNVAGVLNQGVEFQISGQLLSPQCPVQWKSSFNITYNDNRVHSLPDGNRDIIIDYWDGYTEQYAYYIVGKPLNAFYGIITDGVINNESDFFVNPYTGEKGRTKWGLQQLGSPKWRDINGDYKISDAGTENDKTFYGNPNPKFFGGFSNNFQYRNWGLNIMSNFTFARDIYNQTLQRRLSNLFFYGNSTEFAMRAMPDLEKLNYWKKEGDQATWPAMNVWNKPQYSFLPGQSSYMENGWYWRISQITLNYRFRNQAFLKHLGVSQLNIWGNVNNVCMFQSASVPDAERVDAQGRDMGDGYPVPRSYTLGVTIDF